MVNKAEVVRNRYVCYECGAYFRVKTGNRLKMVLDPQSFEEWFAEEHGTNPLDFPGYVDKLTAVREKTGLKEAVTVGKGKIYGEDAVIGVCDARFMMGSMGHAVGEKIAGAVERATEEKLPVILFCCSGGARMQEGIVSLMQMAKTAAALKKHSDAGLLYISVLTDPTTGGVTASFAMLGDIILAEPGALIGFAGARVIEQTIGQKLPEGFQRAEFQLEHGFVDAIVERKDLKKRLYEILRMHKVSGYAKFDPATEVDGRPTELMRERAYNTKEKSAWEKVKMARKVDRLSAEDYINSIFIKFIEFHGEVVIGNSYRTRRKRIPVGVGESQIRPELFFVELNLAERGLRVELQVVVGKEETELIRRRASDLKSDHAAEEVEVVSRRSTVIVGLAAGAKRGRPAGKSVGRVVVRLTANRGERDSRRRIRKNILRQRLTDQVVSVNLPGWDSSEVADALGHDYDIAVRAGGHCAPRMHRALGTQDTGAVRFSFGCFTTEEDVGAALAALAELAAEGEGDDDATS